MRTTLAPFAKLRPISTRLSGIALLLALPLAACGLMPEAPTIGISNVTSAPPEVAVAHVTPLAGSEVSGEVRFTRRGNDTLVEVSLSHLTPGVHGFHVHEKGDCSSADGLSAGGHFNPDAMDHGGPDSPHHHLGDLGNLTAGMDGIVNMNFHVQGLAISGDHGVAGHAIIVHAAADDYATQPSGNSGKRQGCGVIAGT